MPRLPLSAGAVRKLLQEIESSGGAVAYGGTRALGEVARLRFSLAATPRRA